MTRTIITRAKASNLIISQVHNSTSTSTTHRTSRRPFQESYHNIQHEELQGERMPKKRPSSPSFASTAVLSKKIRSKHVADQDSSVAVDSAAAPVLQGSLPSDWASSKRPMGLDERDSPRKRVRSEVNLSTDLPRLDLSTLTSSESRRSSQGKLPSIFTPLSRNRAVSSPPRINHGYEAAYQDFVIPLNDLEEKSHQSSRPIPPTPPRTVNPFAAGKSEKNGQESAEADRSAGDTFGPAVPPLASLLTEGNGSQGASVTPAAPQSTSASAIVADDASPAPTPFKKSKLFKKPSQIPRLAMAPPTPARPLASSSSTSKLHKLTTSKSAIISGSKSSILASSSKFKHPHPPGSVKKGPRMSNLHAVNQAAKPAVRRTTLSREAQTSLANLSSAIEKLSLPRPRSSMGPTSGSLRSSLSGHSVLDDLPPRPSSVMEQKRYSPGLFGSRLESHSDNEKSSKNGRSFGSKSSRPSTSSAISGLLASKSSRRNDSTKSSGESAADAKGKGKEVDSASTAETEVEVEEEPESECLKDCVIFVDVRTDDGADASPMFIQMLRRLSARIISRPGTTATHIVWKSGLQSTLTKYNSMQDPKPLMVGIGWVVQCVEKKQRVLETKYLVDLKEAEIVFGGKRRRSMHVKDRSALTEGLIPARRPPVMARSSSNPLISKTTSSTLGRAKTAGRFARQMKLPFASKAVPPTPVREEPEPSESEAAEERMELTLVEQEEDPVDVEMEERKNEEWAAKEIARQAEKNVVAPAVTRSTAQPPSSSSSSGSSSNKASNSSKQKLKKEKGFADLLAQAHSALLEEAKASQQEAVERARRRSLLFAPKISSPLKKTIPIPKDGNESD